MERHAGQQKAAMRAAAEGLKAAVAKCALMAREIQTDNQIAKAMIDEVQTKVAAIHSLCSSFQAGGSTTLSGQLQQAANLASAASAAFVQGLTAEETSGDDLKRLTGMVFQRCQELCGIATDNRTAIGRRILQIAVGVKDVSREIRELLSEMQASDQPGFNSQGASPPSDLSAENRLPSGQCLPAGDELTEAVSNLSLRSGICTTPKVSGAEETSDNLAEDDLEDLRTEPASHNEVIVTKAAESLVGKISGMLTASLRVLQQCTADLTGEEVLWETHLKQLSHLATNVNDLGAGLYPPQQKEELQNPLDGIIAACNAVGSTDMITQGEHRQCIQDTLEICKRMQDAIRILDN